MSNQMHFTTVYINTRFLSWAMEHNLLIFWIKWLIFALHSNQVPIRSSSWPYATLNSTTQCVHA
jgi:hypothetical protein